MFGNCHGHYQPPPPPPPPPPPENPPPPPPEDEPGGVTELLIAVFRLLESWLVLEVRFATLQLPLYQAGLYVRPLASREAASTAANFSAHCWSTPSASAYGR
jgi:hypothetical protein